VKLRPFPEDEPAINLTPMIDVVFTLLVFFMLATTFAERERLLDLELPYAASAADAKKPTPQELVINVAREGKVFVDGKSLEETQLSRILSDTAQRDRRTMVTIRGDRRGAYDGIVHVLDACLQAGLVDVSLGALEQD
jgi:biopolymer transport protein ExbD